LGVGGADATKAVAGRSSASGAGLELLIPGAASEFGRSICIGGAVVGGAVFGDAVVGGAVVGDVEVVDVEVVDVEVVVVELEDVDVPADGPVANAAPAVSGPATMLTPIAACTILRTSSGLIRPATVAHPRPVAPGRALATSRTTAMSSQPTPTQAATAAVLASS
jgi:hypothetical protein